MRREELLDLLTERIVRLSSGRPLRVAVDGVDAAGKTMLADAFVPVLRARGRPVIRASIDGFHRPRVERYRRGPDSPEGYYHDSFDYQALREALLLPLGPLGSGRYRRAVFDYHADSSLATVEETAPPDAVLIMDGVFLLRPELDGCWDYRIWVDVPFAVTLERAKRRDVTLFGSEEAVEARYQARYIPGQRLYFEMARPREQADAIVYNEDLANPLLTFRSNG